MLSELAERKVTLDLTPYVEDKTLDLSKFPESLAKYGVVDGEQAGVALAENTPGLIYNKSKLKEFGVAEPTTGMTWEAFITWAKEVSTKSGGKMPGTMDRARTTRRSGSGCASRARSSTTARSWASPPRT